MIKEKILEKLLEKIKNELSQAQEVCDSASSYKEDQDMKQEAKYDTRAIEAGYLAGAQAKRVEELKLDLQMIEEIESRVFKDDEDIAIGALVDLELKGQSQSYFISSTGGGTILNIDGCVVLVISVFSPIGAALVGLNKGDEFEIETPKDTRSYKVLNIH